MARRNTIGSGGITKLSGKRKRPYMAYISKMVAEGIDISPLVKKSVKSKENSIVEAETFEEVARLLAEGMLAIDKATGIDLDTYKADAVKKLNEHLRKHEVKQKQVKKPIGYFAKYDEARIALADYVRNPYDLDSKKITFAEIYALAYKDARVETKSKSLQDNYRAAFAKCAPIHGMPIADIRHMHLQGIIDEYAGKSASTQSQIIMAQRLTFAYALKNDLVEKDYAAFVKLSEVSAPEEKKAFTREDVQKVWDNIDYTHTAQRVSVLDNVPVAKIAVILLYTGMRIDELLSIEPNTVHLEERYIDLRGTKTKAAKRLVPIHKKILPIIEGFLNEGNKTLVSDCNGNKLKYSNFNAAAWSEFMEKMGMDYNIHEARHTFATYSMSSKLDSTLRQYIMGHTTGSITNEVYTHPEVLLPELIAEIDKYRIVT